MIVRLESLDSLLPSLDDLAVDGLDVLCLLYGDFGSLAALLGSVLAFGLLATFVVLAAFSLFFAAFSLFFATFVLFAAFVVLASFLLLIATLVLLAAFVLFTAFGLVASFILVLATLGLAALVLLGAVEYEDHTVAVDLYAGNFGAFNYIGAFFDGGFVNQGVVSNDHALKHAAVGAEELLYLCGLLGTTCNKRCGCCKEKQNLFHD